MHQVSIHVCPDICGLLGDDNGDTGTIRSNLSAAAIVTSKTAPPTPIDYLTPRPTPLSPKTNTLESQPKPTVYMTDTTNKVDPPESSPTPTATPSIEVAPRDRLEGSSDN